MRKLTVDNIISQIKTLSHDITLQTDLIYSFINQALNDIQSESDYNFQVIRNEKITIPANTQTISTQYPLKSLIEYSPENLVLQINQGNIELKSAPDKDTEITLTYIRQIPVFDGNEDNNIFPDSDLLITGATYYALLYNIQPEAQMYWQLFQKKLIDFVRLNAFTLPIPEVEDVTGLGI